MSTTNSPTFSVNDDVWVHFKSMDHEATVLDINDDEGYVFVRYDSNGKKEWVPSDDVSKINMEEGKPRRRRTTLSSPTTNNANSTRATTVTPPSTNRNDNAGKASSRKGKSKRATSRKVAPTTETGTITPEINISDIKEGGIYFIKHTDEILYPVEVLQMCPRARDKVKVNWIGYNTEDRVEKNKLKPITEERKHEYHRQFGTMAKGIAELKPTTAYAAAITPPTEEANRSTRANTKRKLELRSENDAVDAPDTRNKKRKSSGTKAGSRVESPPKLMTTTIHRNSFKVDIHADERYVTDQFVSFSNDGKKEAEDVFVCIGTTLLIDQGEGNDDESVESAPNWRKAVVYQKKLCVNPNSKQEERVMYWVRFENDRHLEPVYLPHLVEQEVIKVSGRNRVKANVRVRIWDQQTNGWVYGRVIDTKGQGHNIEHQVDLDEREESKWYRLPEEDVELLDMAGNPLTVDRDIDDFDDDPFKHFADPTVTDQFFPEEDSFYDLYVCKGMELPINLDGKGVKKAVVIQKWYSDETKRVMYRLRYPNGTKSWVYLPELIELGTSKGPTEVIEEDSKISFLNKPSKSWEKGTVKKIKYNCTIEVKIQIQPAEGGDLKWLALAEEDIELLLPSSKSRIPSEDTQEDDSADPLNGSSSSEDADQELLAADEWALNPELAPSLTTRIRKGKEEGKTKKNLFIKLHLHSNGPYKGEKLPLNRYDTVQVKKQERFLFCRCLLGPGNKLVVDKQYFFRQQARADLVAMDFACTNAKDFQYKLKKVMLPKDVDELDLTKKAYTLGYTDDGDERKHFFWRVSSCASNEDVDQELVAADIWAVNPEQAPSLTTRIRKGKDEGKTKKNVFIKLHLHTTGPYKGKKLPLNGYDTVEVKKQERFLFCRCLLGPGNKLVVDKQYTSLQQAWDDLVAMDFAARKNSYYSKLKKVLLPKDVDELDLTKKAYTLGYTDDGDERKHFFWRVSSCASNEDVDQELLAADIWAVNPEEAPPLTVTYRGTSKKNLFIKLHLHSNGPYKGEKLPLNRYDTVQVKKQERFLFCRCLLGPGNKLAVDKQYTSMRQARDDLVAMDFACTNAKDFQYKLKKVMLPKDVDELDLTKKAYTLGYTDDGDERKHFFWRVSSCASNEDVDQELVVADIWAVNPEEAPSLTVTYRGTSKKNLFIKLHLHSNGPYKGEKLPLNIYETVVFQKHQKKCVFDRCVLTQDNELVVDKQYTSMRQARDDLMAMDFIASDAGFLPKLKKVMLPKDVDELDLTKKAYTLGYTDDGDERKHFFWRAGTVTVPIPDSLPDIIAGQGAGTRSGLRDKKLQRGTAKVPIHTTWEDGNKMKKYIFCREAPTKIWESVEKGEMPGGFTATFEKGNTDWVEKSERRTETTNKFQTHNEGKVQRRNIIYQFNGPDMGDGTRRFKTSCRVPHMRQMEYDVATGIYNTPLQAIHMFQLGECQDPRGVFLANNYENQAMAYCPGPEAGCKCHMDGGLMCWRCGTLSQGLPHLGIPVYTFEDWKELEEEGVIDYKVHPIEVKHYYIDKSGRHRRKNIPFTELVESGWIWLEYNQREPWKKQYESDPEGCEKLWDGLQEAITRDFNDSVDRHFSAANALWRPSLLEPDEPGVDDDDWTDDGEECCTPPEKPPIHHTRKRVGLTWEEKPVPQIPVGSKIVVRHNGTKKNWYYGEISEGPDEVGNYEIEWIREPNNNHNYPNTVNLTTHRHKVLKDNDEYHIRNGNIKHTVQVGDEIAILGNDSRWKYADVTGEVNADGENEIKYRDGGIVCHCDLSLHTVIRRPPSEEDAGQNREERPPHEGGQNGEVDQNREGRPPQEGDQRQESRPPHEGDQNGEEDQNREVDQNRDGAQVPQIPRGTKIVVQDKNRKLNWYKGEIEEGPDEEGNYQIIWRPAHRVTIDYPNKVNLVTHEYRTLGKYDECHFKNQYIGGSLDENEKILILEEDGDWHEAQIIEDEDRDGKHKLRYAEDGKECWCSLSLRYVITLCEEE